MRLFVALPIPDWIADDIARIQWGIEDARWSPRENLHITLRFIGDADAHQGRELDDLLGAISVAPFEIEAGGVDHFNHDQPYALWLGVKKTAPLLALHKACERACQGVGFGAETRTYTPHITICYLPRQQAPAPIIAFEQRHNLLNLPPWRADRFYLYNSHTAAKGPSRYTIEAEYPLIG
jgi:RNA 2',3'-cyclic 3'-phosphodiesterase